MQGKTKFHKFLTSGSGLAILVVALIFALGAVGLFWLSDLLGEQQGFWKAAASPFRQTATLLLTVGGVQFLIRTKIWKDALESVGDRLQIKQAALDAGLLDYWSFDNVCHQRAARGPKAARSPGTRGPRGGEKTHDGLGGAGAMTRVSVARRTVGETLGCSSRVVVEGFRSSVGCGILYRS
jgi:hypothetical protein